MEIKRTLIYRAKGVNPCDGWVKGGIYYVDNNVNDPFCQTPLKGKYYIVSYRAGDWNMGKWEHIEVIPETIQQCTGYVDDNNQEIYEGDVLLINREVSYDEDGTRSLGMNSSYNIVMSKDGAFRIDTDELLHKLDKDYECCYQIVGNIFEIQGIEKVINYRTGLLCDDFDKHHDKTFPELIEVAYFEFAKEAASIPMDSYKCTYDKEKHILSIYFTKDSVNYHLVKSNIDDTPEYTLYKYNTNEIIHKYDKLNISDNFNEIIDTIKKTV